LLILGAGGAFAKMLVAGPGGALSAQGTMMMIGSYVLGAVVGEWINIEDRLEALGRWLRAKTGSGGDARFVEAFVTSSLIVCIGAMAVVGAIQDALERDIATLAAKAVLDLVIIMMLTASLGRGCIFSALPVGVFQGSVTLLAVFIAPLMTPQALANLSMTGSMMIFCVGVNILRAGTFRVANLLPTLVFAVLWPLLPWA
ncbi:MAG: DUF554 domain-containing protein, partial [Duodenibacillus sp.]|nr:DUF554 domain-containing protein [Duodenibacillus sp.]